MPVNTCQQCQREFSCKRRDKRFCSSSCRWVQSHEGQGAAPVPSESMIALGLAIKGAAPQGTIGYRLGLRAGKALHWFPSQAGKSRRWDGSFSDRPYFLLTQKDYEPPRVPKSTSYLIQFIDASGQTLPTPPSFDSGVWIAEATRMSWPGTHRVREPREGRVRNVVDLGAGRSPAKVKVKPGSGSGHA